MCGHTSSSGDGTAPFHILDFPPEILRAIFSHLTTNERKPVKLVCQSWFEICNALPSVDEEILYCLGIYKLSDMYQFLSRSQRKFLNLKFDRVRFDGDSSFWKQNGSRIRSIILKDCYDSNGIVEAIVIFCENLFHLSFIFPLYFCPFKHIPLPLVELRTVFEEGIVRANLKSLEIYINRNWKDISDYTINQLFTLFPSIEILKIFCLGCQPEVRNLDAVNMISSEFSKEDITLHPFLNYLRASTNRIKKLVLNFERTKFPSTTRRIISETLAAMGRLTEVSINFPTTGQLEEIEEFFFSKPLESLEYYCPEREGSLELFLLQLLVSNPSLKHLAVRTRSPLIVTKALFEKLLLSGLKSFTIHITRASILLLDSDSFDSCFSEGNRPNTFPKLSVTMMHPDEGLVPFLKYFQNIRHLDLDYITYDELEALIKYQTKLKNLVLCEKGGDWTNAEELTAMFKNAFYKLTDTEHLEFRGSAVPYVLLRSLSPGLTFANMKYLKLATDPMSSTHPVYHHLMPPKTAQGIEQISVLNFIFSLQLFPSDLLKLADAMPFLEELLVSFSSSNEIFFLSFDFCVKLLAKLSRLRLFYTSSNIQFEDESRRDEYYEEFFSVCPSLRFFRYRVLDYRDRMRYIFIHWDILNKKVLHQERRIEREEDIFAEPNMDGPHVVDWFDD